MEQDDFADFLLDTTAPFGFFGASGIIAGKLETVGDHDWINTGVFVHPGQIYQIVVNGSEVVPGALADPFLRLLDSSGKVIFQDDDSGSGFNSFIPFTPLASGPYYIEVSAEDLSTGSGTGTYSVEIKTLDFFSGSVQTVYWFMNNDALPSNQLLNLASFVVNQFQYGQQIGVLNPRVYVYEALGQALSEGSVVFQDQWHPADTTNLAFVSDAYDLVFGIQPGAAQVQHFLAQLDYFETLYVASGAFGPDITRIEILARGAVFGQMLGVNFEIGLNNASTVASNLIDDSSVSTVGGLATMDFALL